ncbi:hypothetical protein ACWFNS_17770 [Oerskovia enterophila]
MTSDFSKAFSRHLRDVMSERDVRQVPLAERLERSQGFVSERTSGRRPVDTDIIAAVAEMAGMGARELVEEISARMRDDRQRGATVHALPSRGVSSETDAPDAATVQYKAVANEDQSLEEEGIAQLD